MDQPWLLVVNQQWFSQSNISQKRLDLCKVMKLYSDEFGGKSSLAAAMKLSLNTTSTKAKQSLPAGDAAHIICIGPAASHACSSKKGTKWKADSYLIEAERPFIVKLYSVQAACSQPAGLGGATSAWPAFYVTLIRINVPVRPGPSVWPKMRPHESRTVQITIFRCFLSFAVVV